MSDLRKKHRLHETLHEGAISLQLYESGGEEFYRLIRETPKGPVEVGVGRQAEMKSVANVFERAVRSPRLERQKAVPERSEKPEPDSTMQLSAETPKPGLWSAIRGSVESLRGLAKRLWPAGDRKEPEQPKGQVWYALVKMTELTETGGAGVVLLSFNDRRQAEVFRDKNNHVALYPKPFAEQPTRGTKVEITKGEVDALIRKDEGRDFAHQFELLRWKSEQGRFFNFGYWNDRSEEPRPGQLVKFTTGLDYRNKPVDRLVSPLRSYDAGEAGTPRPVVFEMHRDRPGIGRFVCEAPNSTEALKVVRDCDAKRVAREQVHSEEGWRTLVAGKGLRAVADVEMTHPGVRPNDVATQAISALDKHLDDGLTIRTHTSGRYRADVITRRGEEGELQRSVIVTREFTDGNGVRRSAGAVFDFDEVMAYRQRLIQFKERQNQREQPQVPGHDETKRDIAPQVPNELEKPREVPKRDVGPGSPKEQGVPRIQPPRPGQDHLEQRMPMSM